MTSTLSGYLNFQDAKPTVKHTKKLSKIALEVIELWNEDAKKAGEPIPPPRALAVA
jgi:hypothetical protein